MDEALLPRSCWEPLRFGLGLVFSLLMKQVFRKHINRLLLTPQLTTPFGPLYSR